MKALVRLCLRVPELMAASTYEIRCGDPALAGILRGQPMPPDWNPTTPDWWRGSTYLPFVWEEAGELALPTGRSTLVMNPTWIPYGNFFCDVPGLELTPLA